MATLIQCRFHSRNTKEDIDLEGGVEGQEREPGLSPLRREEKEEKERKEKEEKRKEGESFWVKVKSSCMYI